MALTFAQVVLIASTAYQFHKQEQMRKKQKRMEELRKGLQFVTEGEVLKMPICYGRNLIGGVRAYHKTLNNFKYATPNADKSFLTGIGAGPGGTYTEYTYAGDSVQETIVNYDSIPSQRLEQDISGKKNEFLFYQQALCAGPINAVYDVILEGDIYLDDPSLGTAAQVFTGSYGFDTSALNKRAKAALRFDCHYGDTPKADAILVANLPERKNAKFTNLAHVAGCIKLDRNEPQFQKVPDAQFLIEGRKVKTISNGTLSTGRTYSNSSPLCLLDYMTDLVFGPGIDISKFDLASFESAHILGRRTAVSNAIVGGNIWKPIDGSRSISNRDVHLFECNITLNTGDTFRDNITKILNTMGDARLLWSDNKYRLVVQVPQTEQEIVLAGTITDDLILNTEATLRWPDAESKLNFATATFYNEAKNFKEDSISWPSKLDTVSFIGVGGRNYPQPNDSWEEKNVARRFLNTYGVWSGVTNLSVMNWKFVVKTTGVHTFTWTADNSSSVVINGATVSSNSSNTLYTHQFTATKDQIISIVATVTDSGGLKAFAGTVEDSSGFLVWNSRDVSFSDFIQRTETSTVYDAFLAEDNGVNLEANVFLDGITDYYHALAHVEEMVRTSRSAAELELSVLLKDRFYEPGDIIKVNSTELSIENTYFKVKKARLKQGLVEDLTLIRFDISQIAWNVDDLQYIAPPPISNFNVPRPETVTFVRNSNSLVNSSGRVEFSEVPDSRVTGYKIYVHNALNNDSIGLPIFDEIGTTKDLFFELPKLSFRTGIVAVAAITPTRSSELRLSAPVVFNDRSLSMLSTSSGFIKTSATTFEPANITLSASISGFQSPEIKWYKDGVLLPENTNSLYIEPTETGVINRYKVSVQEVGDPTTLLYAEKDIFSIEEGEASVVIEMSNFSVALTSDNAGHVTDYSSATATVNVMQGLNNLSESWSFKKQDSAGVVSKLNNSTANNTVVATGILNVPLEIVSITDGADTGYVDIIATFDTITITRRFSISKTKSGADANAVISVASIDVYYSSELQPSVPALASYNFSTDALSGLTAGWSREFPVVDDLTIWRSTARFQTSDIDIPAVNVYWSTPVVAARPGQLADRSAVLDLYKWSDSTPVSFPSGISVYTWATSQFTAPATLNGWALVPPTVEVGKTLYVCRQLYSDRSDSLTSEVTWTQTSSFPISYAGVDGNDSKTLKIVSNQTFKFNSLNNPEPPTQTISIEILTTNLVGTPSVSCELFDASGVSLGFVALGGSGSSRTITVAQFNNANYAIVNASLLGFSDTTKIVRVTDGASGESAITVYLTNMSHVVPAQADGSLLAGWNSDAGGNFKVFYGSMDVTDQCTFSVFSETAGLDVSINSATGVYSVNSLSVDSGKAVLRANYNSTNHDLEYSIAKARQGISGENATQPVFATLSNESHTLPASDTGNVTNFNGTSTDLGVFDGSQRLNYDGVGTSNGTYNITLTANNVTIATPNKTDLGADVRVNGITAISQDSGNIVINITGKLFDGTSFNLTKQQNFTKLKQGTPGKASTLYWITNSNPSINKSTSGVFTPSAISFSAYKSEGNNAPVLYAGRFKVSVSTNGSTFSLTYTSTNNESSISYNVPVNARLVKVELFLAGGTTTLLDFTTSTVVNDGVAGDSGLVVDLTNENHTFTANYDGVVSSYIGSETDLHVFEGAAELIYDGIGTSNGTYRVERTSWNITQGSAIDKGTYISFGAASAFQSTEDNGSITYRVIGKRLNGGSIDYSVQQTFSKAKKGSPTNFYYMASSIYSVRRLSNGTINPTQITLNGYYGNDVNPKIAYAGRLRLEYSDDGGQTWTVHSQSTVDETSRTINIPTGVARNAIRARLFESGGFTKVLDEEVIPYISDGTNGTNGVRTAVLEMYRWSAAQPTTFPSGNSTYTWATGSFTSPSSPNGWSLTPGAVVKGQTLWAISVIYTDSATSPTSIITWSSSAPYVAGYAGADGSTGDPGNPGLQVAWPSVFAWGSAPPSSLPAGTSSYNWSNGSFNLVTANGWSTSPPANPGTPGFKLWTVRRYITANAGTASTNFTWSGSAEAISANGANGVDGLKSASPTMFQWSNSVTPPALAGSTSFTWSSNDFSTSGITAGWVKTPGTGNPGQTLWAATVSLLDNAGAVTTTIDWSTASISPRGYQGLAGSTGSPGADGLSSRLAYTISASDTLSTPTATIGSSSLPVGYTSTPGTPTPNTNQKLFQTNGLYNPNTNQITWSTPYISTLRAGQLSVLSAYTGSLTVADRLTVVSGGDIVGGSFTGYAWPASGDGFYIGLSGILLGNKNTGPYLQMTRAGNIYSTQFKIENGVATFSGTLNATAGYFRGEMSTNGATYASGSGFYANGTQLRFGSLTSGLRYDGTKTEIFGDVVLTGNVKIDQITTRAQSTYDASVIPATGNITANASSLTFNTGSLPVTFSGNGNNLIETNVELYVHTNTTSGSTEAIRYLVEYQLYMNKGSITSISNMQRVLVATKKATDVHGFTANAMAYVPLTLSSIVTTSAGTGYVYMRITVRPYKSDDAALTFGSVGGTGGKYAYQLNLVNVEFKR